MSRISCIMASRGMAFPAQLAIDCYRRQTYADRELIIVSAAAAPDVAEIVADLNDPAIRFLAAPAGSPVGVLRNMGIAAASGAFICVWDDDDLSHPERLRWQHDALTVTGAEACVAGRVLLWWPQRQRLAVSARRTWENSLLARRSTMPAYSDKPRGSDTEVMLALLSRGQPAVVERADAYMYVAHDRNLWGASHFEMLFGHGREIVPADYSRAMAGIAPAMPVEAYARGLGLSVRLSAADDQDICRG